MSKNRPDSRGRFSGGLVTDVRCDEELDAACVAPELADVRAKTGLELIARRRFTVPRERVQVATQKIKAICHAIASPFHCAEGSGTQNATSRSPSIA
jgi:hypothetical protein